MPGPTAFFEPAKDGVRARIRLTPGASADRIKQVAADQNGVAWLTATVTAPPEDGRANRALVRMLAKEWRVAKSGIEIISGLTDRRKTLRLEGDAAAVLATLSRWSRRHGGAA